jgi:predicted nicotinamide N-methyase
MQELQRSAAPLRPRVVQLTLPEPVGELSVEEDVHGAGPGGCVWDASLSLAHYVVAELSQQGGLRGVRVVELGAGCGVPGLAAAQLGADVFLTDRCDGNNNYTSATAP